MVKKLFLFAFILLSVKLLAQSPILSNFRIENSEKSRVYFDSSDPINSITTTGFIINGKTISSVIINTGSKTGHYFTVSSAFTFWDNNTIRLVNGNSTVEDFTLTYIENRIPEPDVTGTIYYVAVNGSDSNNGTDENAPFKTVQKALKVAKAGNTVYVKAGTYVTTGSTYMRDNDGTPTSPIKVIGYKNVPGDITSMYYSFTPGSVAPALDPSEMPLMDGNNIHNSGIYVDDRDYIIIKNMQFKRYFKGLASGDNKGLLVENCVTKEMFGAGGNEEGAGISLGSQNSGSAYAPSYFRIKSSIALNSGMVNMRLTGSHGLIDNCKVYSDKSGGGGTIGTDYYIDIGGDNNIIINSSAEAIDATVNPSSHGIGAKGTEWNYSDWGMYSTYNLFQNIYVKTGSQEGVYARNIRADFNVFKDCEIAGFGTGNYDGIGISNQTGAQNNIYERMNIHDLKSAIMFKGGTESGTSPANNVTDGNIIRNSTIKNVANVIETQRTQTIVYTFSNNKIYNCTINGAGNMLKANDSSLGYYSLSNNEIVNSIFIGVSSENGSSRKPSLQEMFAIDYSNFHNGFPKPSWSTNSISEDPKLGTDLKTTLATPETIYDGGKDIPGLYFDADHFPRQSGKYSMGAYDNEDATTGSVSPNVSICNGENTTLVASEGTSYSWNTGESTASITVNPSATTTYTVTISDGTNSDSHDVIVTVDEEPSVDLGTDQSICYGESVILTATGTGDFLWNTGETTASITVNPTVTTTYSITASNSCATDATDDVIVNVNPEIGLTVGNDTSICVGESTTLTASGNGDFLWSTGETTSSITVQPNSTTTYSVTSSLGSCTENESVIVTVNLAPSVDLGPDQSICYGESVILTATGTGDFLWNTGETTANITVNPTATTTYSVTASNSCTTNVTDDIIVNVNPEIGLTVGNDISICVGESTTLTATGNGDFLWSTGETTSSITVQPNSTTTYSVTSNLGTCTENESVLVTVDVAPSVDLGSDQSICYGETIILSATGIGNFLWSTGETTSSITVNPTTTTTYTVTASNACSDDVSDDVIINVNPEIGLTVGNDISICTGESTTLTASGNGDFLWSTGETTSSITVQPNSTTTYTITSSLGNCTENADVIVTISDLASVDLGADKSICNGESVTLTATGTGNFLWSTGETTSSITVNPTATITYSVTASNSCSADATDDIIVNVNELPSVNAGEDTTITNGESTTLTATGNGNFLWSTGETSPSITVNPTSTTTYSVIITSDQGCLNQDTVVVTVDTPESVAADAGPDQNICPDDSDTVLTASGGDSYLWSTGETTASITVRPTVTTVYTVAVYVGNNHTLDEVTVYIDESCSNNISSEQQELKIYPNPTNGLVNLEMTGFSGDLNVSLYNLNGSVVHTENMNNSSKEKVLKSQINLSRLAKGMYFVRLNNGSQVVTKKLMVI